MKGLEIGAPEDPEDDADDASDVSLITGGDQDVEQRDVGECVKEDDSDFDF